MRLKKDLLIEICIQLDIMPRQYRSNQGRSPEKQRESYIAVFVSVVGMVLILGVTAIMNSI
jgi:hypothetical protein